MLKWVTMSFEIALLVMNFVIFLGICELKSKTRTPKIVLCVSFVVMTAMFCHCVVSLKWGESLASFVCMTVPTAILFWFLSKYKDGRFFVTFCFLDVITYTFAYFGRIGYMYFSYSSYIIITALAAYSCFVFRPYLIRYRTLTNEVDDGWNILAVSTFSIYVLLIITTSYPKPLAERKEYIPLQTLFTLCMVTIFMVFFMFLQQKMHLAHLNRELLEKKKWHEIAYSDGLTGLGNRTAYIEKINTLERVLSENENVFAIMIDVDQFKMVNDSYGHSEGDATLKKIAELISEVFASEGNHIFRIGGDEFAVITRGIDEAGVKALVEMMSTKAMSRSRCSVSVGYAKVDIAGKQTIEEAFVVADEYMYKSKTQKKAAVTAEQI